MAGLEMRYRSGHRLVVHWFPSRPTAQIAADPQSPAQRRYPSAPIAAPETATARHLGPAAVGQDLAVAGKGVHQLGVPRKLGAEWRHHLGELFRQRRTPERAFDARASCPD